TTALVGKNRFGHGVARHPVPRAPPRSLACRPRAATGSLREGPQDDAHRRRQGMIDRSVTTALAGKNRFGHPVAPPPPPPAPGRPRGGSRLAPRGPSGRCSPPSPRDDRQVSRAVASRKSKSRSRRRSAARRAASGLGPRGPFGRKSPLSRSTVAAPIGPPI